MNKDMLAYVKQPRVIITLVLVGVLFLLNLLQVILSVKGQGFKVATRYSASDQLVISTGYWYYLYSYLAFSVLSLVFGAIAIFKLVSSKHPNIAFAALLVTGFILVFCLLDAHVILNLSRGV